MEFKNVYKNEVNWSNWCQKKKKKMWQLCIIIVYIKIVGEKVTTRHLYYCVKRERIAAAANEGNLGPLVLMQLYRPRDIERGQDWKREIKLKREYK